VSYPRGIFYSLYIWGVCILVGMPNFIYFLITDLPEFIFLLVFTQLILFWVESVTPTSQGVAMDYGSPNNTATSHLYIKMSLAVIGVSLLVDAIYRSIHDADGTRVNHNPTPLAHCNPNLNPGRSDGGIAIAYRTEPRATRRTTRHTRPLWMLGISIRLRIEPRFHLLWTRLCPAIAKPPSQGREKAAAREHHLRGDSVYGGLLLLCVLCALLLHAPLQLHLWVGSILRSKLASHLASKQSHKAR